MPLISLKKDFALLNERHKGDDTNMAILNGVLALNVQFYVRLSTFHCCNILQIREMQAVMGAFETVIKSDTYSTNV